MKHARHTARQFSLLAFFLVVALTAGAQFWGATKPRPIETPKDSLKKGEFTWAPELSPQGPILVTVSLDEQRAYTYRNGILIGVSTVSTGKSGYETPTGVFHTILKDAKHRSSKYNNASMPYTQKFTQYGVALHAGGLPGYPSSHGCVHLPSEYARLLFNVAPMGMTVVVTKGTKSPESVNHPAFLSPVTASGTVQEHERLAADEKYRWNPEKSPAGPVSMIISRADQRMVVSRNGVEIGRSRVSIARPADSVGTIVLVAHNGPVASGGLQWMTAELADVHYGSGQHGDAQQQLSRIQIPDGFKQAIQPLLTDGTTLVITDAPILRKTTGKQVGVLSSHPGS